MKRRNPIACLLLAFFIPFYPLYWCYATGRELEKQGTENFPTIVPLIAVSVLYVVGLIYMLVTTASYDAADSDPAPYFFGLVALVPIIWVLSIVYFYKFSKQINRIVSVDMGDKLLTFIFILLPPIPIYMIQEKLNQHADQRRTD